MLILLNEQTDNFHIFHHYSGLFNFIEAQEKQRSDRKAKWKAQSWVFTRHSHRRMMSYQGVFSNPMAGMGRDANGWDILEVVSGNPDNPVFIPLAHNVDIEPLQQNWCRKYCKVRGYILIDIADILGFKKLAGSLGNEKQQ